MLQLVIPQQELWNEYTQEFVYTKPQVLQLEHSLVSISKWEAKWHKSFISSTVKSHEEEIDYVRCMTITQNVDPNVYNYLTRDNLNAVNKYIEAPMSATYVFEDGNQQKGTEKITSELIYYWMIAFGIPFDPCQKWHLNRLLMLIKVCSVKNRSPKKRMSHDKLQNRARLNAERKRRYNSKG